MEGINLFIGLSNLLVSAIILLIVAYQKVAPPTHSSPPPGNIMRRSSGKTKPRWNDEAKELQAEKKELRDRPLL